MADRKGSLLSSMSMQSMASQESERSKWSAGSDGQCDASMSSSYGDDLELEEIDDLVDRLVVEATQQYAVDTICSTTMPGDKRIVYTPERQVINVAVKKLNIYHLKEEDAGKSYYELRILADTTVSTDLGYDREDISSVLIGYACLDGMDNGCQVRRYSFQDSQHLFKLCEVLGQRGRFEDAAF